jgi:hypothetical protein
LLCSLSIANVLFLPLIDESGLRNSSLAVNMDFQDVSSYMNPDIADIIGMRHDHLIFVGGIMNHVLKIWELRFFYR